MQQRVAAGECLWDALNSTAPAPVRFVAPESQPAGTAYEAFIAATRQCPTRPGLHDFFNGLCWIHFPASKQRMNQLQAAQIARDGIGPHRGPVRDALTLFDENAAFLRAPQPLWDALAGKQWHTLFADLRPLWREASLVLFGHALLEKLQAPRKAITAHVYRVFPAQDTLAALDHWVAQDLDSTRLARKPFAHLPVLGVPGWCSANEDPDFYADGSIFRPPRPPALPRQ